MLRRIGKKPVYRIALLLLVLLMGVAALSGCLAQGGVARGWAGGVIKDGILYTGTMEGNLVSVNATGGYLLTSVPLEEQESSSGILSCMAASSSTVAMYGSPVIADDLVCVGGYNGKVYAFSIEEAREEPRWVYPRQDSIGDYIIGGVVYDQGKLYFGGANNIVYALDAADGYKEWEYETGDKIWSTPAVYNGIVYIGSFDYKFYALDAADGTKKWEYQTEGAVVSSPVVSDGKVYFSSFDRNLYALDADSGKLKWKFMADNWFWAKPVVYDDIIYAPCLDGKVYVLDTASGDKVNEFDLGSPLSSSPALIGDVIVIATQDGVIYSIEAGGTRLKELAVLGEDENVFAPVIAGDGKAFIHTYLDTLHEVDAITGAKREIGIE